MKIRDRIKELRRVPAGELLPNPKNWRTHPKAQQDALRGVLAEVGIADALLVRETPAVLQLIDGHLRADTSPDTLWPCLILDVDDAEADKLLATVDPLAAMAETDAAKLDALLHEIDTGSEALQEMLAELAKESGLYKTPEIVEDEVPEPPADPVTKPGDLWLLGEHRLLCGDSTNAEDMRRVLDGGVHLHGPALWGFRGGKESSVKFLPEGWKEFNRHHRRRPNTGGIRGNFIGGVHQLPAGCDGRRLHAVCQFATGMWAVDDDDDDDDDAKGGPKG
jgi:hypothetical protein